MDEVFKALADPVRRGLLDRLRDRDGQTLTELTAGLGMTRQAVTKHLDVLSAAGLVVVRRDGRSRRHHLNAAPISEITDRWIRRHHQGRARLLTDLKHTLEGHTVSQTEFVYVTYIATTPETLWRALTDPAFIARYFDGAGPESDWREGSPVRWRMTADDPAYDWGQRVLVADPPHRLSYTWHNYEPEMARFHPDWTAETLERLRTEPISKVTFTIEPAGASAVKLTVVHDGFAPGSAMLASVGGGWPAILSNLKTVVEGGTAMRLE
ncbi:uncharacterized protein YndB with AHSA1/START domain [Stackebrandtia albiflava]|uniref:Uncharacterized protein YndB with AHSA1/START domain n=1 Tax=Stackebrandtia albiflava TaxID=406432 RepID=A0A562VDI3_9ACTN|nr:metalloregulator ArsR/SmtB family transcription factor [Stackebrandtia albiflava]TWJ15930.1 uncharacterized protein YndB with AHSA1/START domain [Stackebrandtia albiflava]